MMKKILFFVAILSCFLLARSLKKQVGQTSGSSANHVEQIYPASAVTGPYSVLRSQSSKPLQQQVGKNDSVLFELIQAGKSQLLFQKIFNENVFLKKPLEQRHLQALNSRFNQERKQKELFHRNEREWAERDLLALLKGVAMNRQVYADPTLRNEYVQFLRSLMLKSQESLILKRQAALNLSQVGVFLTEAEKKKVWKDIPAKTVSLATVNDMEILGDLLEK
ncbi:MAG: hypothetical protein ACK5P5_12965 [Pseudobdellovibrionaceae bacterium]